MRRRVLAAILAVTTLAVVLFGVPLAVVIGRLLDESSIIRVERLAVLASRDVPTDFGSGQDPVELSSPPDGVEIALYDTDGALIAGVGPRTADEITMRAFGSEVVDAEQGESRVVAVPLASDEKVIGAIRAQQSTLAGDARARRTSSCRYSDSLCLVLGLGALIGWVGCAFGR